nr:PilW family protein [uncultured Cocleimonas sp.]
MIELMISMVVGLFLLAGVVTNFTSTKNADVKRDAVSEMDANAAVAFGILRQAITHAGYTSIENVQLKDNKPFFTTSDGNLTNPTCSNGSLRDVNPPAPNRRTRDSATRDFLSVMYLADNPCKAGLNSCPDVADINPNALIYTDCTGGGSTRDARTVACSTDPVKGIRDNKRDALIYNSFYLIKNISSPNNRVFYCEGSRGGSQPIVENVEAIQYLYGVMADTGNKVYRTANQVEADDQWALVTSVQVGLLLRSSRQNVLDSPSTKKEYFLLKTKVTVADADLRRLFRVYTTTINLENRNSGALL